MTAFIIIFSLLLLLIIGIVYFIYVNKKLKAAKQEAEAAKRTKTEFLANMSHDIRTPLNSIIGMVAIGLNKIDDSEQVTDCLEKINFFGKHLLTLLNDIIDISKIENGKLQLVDQNFSLDETINNIIKIVQPQVEDKNIVLNVDKSDIYNVLLRGDQQRLIQIYINILSNAVKYTRNEGTVNVSITDSVQ